MLKIVQLTAENVKRVKAVNLTPSSNGLTIIGGNNGQGKTSVLDAIAWALGGKKRQPTSPHRDGSMNPPEISVTLSNGIVVERAGKNSSLKVTDPSGQKAGQTLLDSFIGEIALDLPKFLNADSKEKAKKVLQIIGIGEQLAKLEEEESSLYNQRTAVGQLANRKRKYADELPYYSDAPEEPVSVSELIRSQQEILAKNGENQRKRQQLTEIEAQLQRQRERREDLDQKIKDLQRELVGMDEQIKTAENDLVTAQKSSESLQDESTAEIEKKLADIEGVNAQVAANQQKSIAEDEAQKQEADYKEFTEKIEKVRSDRFALLDGADLPLQGLTVENGELLFNGQPWDCMSGAEQLRVAVAIVRRLNPECGFVLMDKLEQMDLETLEEFNAWLKDEDLQVIATRVSTGGECSIVIEDGLPAGQTMADVKTGINASETAQESPSTTNSQKVDW